MTLCARCHRDKSHGAILDKSEGWVCGSCDQRAAFTPMTYNPFNRGKA